MASDLYKPTPSRRVLRRFIFWTIPVGVILAIVNAGMGYPFGLIGLVPMAYSLLLASLISQLDKRERPLKKALVAFLDVFAAFCYLGANIPLWAGPNRVTQKIDFWIYRNNHVDTERVMLISYGSCIYLINMTLHAWLALSEIGLFNLLALMLMTDGRCSRCRDCPMCRADEEQGHPATGRQVQADRGAAYSLLGNVADDDGAEDNPRVSGEA